MEFMRKHRRIIVAVVTITVAVWMIGGAIVFPLLFK